jgi:hypothetical protein
MNYPVILRREDAEGSQNAQLEILPPRYAQGQDDVKGHFRFTGARAVQSLRMT